MKTALVKAFKEARAGSAAVAIEYLPGYHALRDKVRDLAAASSNERHVHTNFNKLVNKTVGFEAGQRRTAAPHTKSAIVVAQTLAAQAMSVCKDHHDGYQNAKQALDRFGQLLIGRSA